MASLTTLDDTLRLWGFEVVDHNLAGRPYPFDCIGVMGHHTAGPEASTSKTPSLNTIINGRSDVPGPLSQLYLGYDALDDLSRGRKPRVHLVTRKRANHAGAGGPWRTIPKDSGNMWIAGIETENVRNNAIIPLLLSLERRAAAAILDHINRDASWYLLHKTWAPTRKPDIAIVEVIQERVLIQRILNAGPHPVTTPVGDVEVRPTQWNDADKELIKKLVGAGSVDRDFASGTENLSLGNIVERIRDDVTILGDKVDQILEKLNTP